MKKLLLILAAPLMLALSSCVGPKFTSSVDYLDYYKLGKEGKVLLTESDTYSGEYESLGSILVEQTSGNMNVKLNKATNKVAVDDGIYGDGWVKTTGTAYKRATCSTALEEAVKFTEEMGGDAIINLHFMFPAPNTVSVSGMVIKRK